MSTADLSHLHGRWTCSKSGKRNCWSGGYGWRIYPCRYHLTLYPAPALRRCRVVTGRTAECCHALQRPDQQRGTRYRTRMAESVYLFRHQRQWFRDQPLQRARTLVADYRFVRRPRNYPKRELPAQTVLSKWVDVPWMNEIKRKALSRLIGDFSIAGFQERSTERILRARTFIVIMLTRKKPPGPLSVPVRGVVKRWRSISLHSPRSSMIFSATTHSGSGRWHCIRVKNCLKISSWKPGQMS